MTVYVKHYDSFVVKVFVSHCDGLGTNSGIALFLLCLNIKNININN